MDKGSPRGDVLLVISQRGDVLLVTAQRGDVVDVLLMGLETERTWRDERRVLLL